MEKNIESSKVIDCEFHYYLPELIDYLSKRKEAPCCDLKSSTFKLREGIAAKASAASIAQLTNFGDSRIADMDKAGIDIAAISSSSSIEELPKKEAVYFAKKSNDAIAELIKKYQGRFIGTAVLPTIYVDEACQELERCIKELGFKYWHTHSNYNNEHLYDDKFLPLLAKAEELGCAFYLHPHLSNSAEMKGVGGVYAGPGLGYGIDAMETALRLIINGTFDKFPRLRMILGHLGEFFPFVLERMDNRFSWAKDPEVTMKQSVSYYFKNKNILVTTSGNMSKPAFKCTVESIGIDNILFGSDYPYENLVDMKNFVDSLDLSEEDKEKVFHLNAEKYIL